jgi:ATP/maltotriose-dependent transcriptional regulator MalT
VQARAAHAIRRSAYAQAAAAGPGRTLRLIFFRGRGPDFSERDRALLTLLRPHLHQAHLDAEHHRRGTPQLTRRQWELLRLVAAGHTNAQIARRPCVSEGTVRKHLENIYSRLHVSSRTAAVTHAFPAAQPRRLTGPPPLPKTARYRPA